MSLNHVTLQTKKGLEEGRIGISKRGNNMEKLVLCIDLCFKVAILKKKQKTDNLIL